MQKAKLNRFIQKYNLGGNVNSVKWKSSGDTLSTSFVTPDKSLLGTVKLDKFPFESSEIGVYQTDQLQKLLNVLGEKIDMDLSTIDGKAIALKVKNDSVSVNYVLSDLSVIADPPALKRLPDFQTKIKLDSNFIDSFIKGKSALSDVDMFAIVKNKTGGCDVIIGYSSSNTNRVNIPVECEVCGLTDAVNFNANLFKEVLVANRECRTATLKVANEGLAKIVFNVDNFESEYFMVSMEDVD